MKHLVIYSGLLSILFVTFVSVMHIECGETPAEHAAHVVQFNDNAPVDLDVTAHSCDGCLHHHTHLFLSLADMKKAHPASDGDAFNGADDSLYSRRYFPPARPPKA